MCRLGIRQWYKQTKKRFYMTTKSPRLNISVFVPSSVGDFEMTGPIRFLFSLRCYTATVKTPSHVSSEVWTFTSTWSWMSNVRSSCPPYTVQPYRKSLRKSFVVHLFERWTVRCSLLVLKMCSSGVADTHKSWSSWLWRHNPSPPSPFWRSLWWFFVVPTSVCVYC